MERLNIRCENDLSHRAKAGYAGFAWDRVIIVVK